MILVAHHLEGEGSVVVANESLKTKPGLCNSIKKQVSGHPSVVYTLHNWAAWISFETFVRCASRIVQLSERRGSAPRGVVRWLSLSEVKFAALVLLR